MISWVVINAFILALPKTSTTWPGGQNIVWYSDSPQIINDKVLFAVHICLIRFINILTSLMISWVVQLLLIFTLPKTSTTQTGVKISYKIYFDSPQIINEKVLFAVHICLIKSINISTSLMVSWLVLMPLTFTLPKTPPTWPGGQNIVRYLDTPPPFY